MTRRDAQTGVSVKQRMKNGMWRHWMLRYLRYESRETGCGTVRHFEVKRRHRHEWRIVATEPYAGPCALPRVFSKCACGWERVEEFFAGARSSAPDRALSNAGLGEGGDGVEA